MDGTEINYVTSFGIRQKASTEQNTINIEVINMADSNGHRYYRSAQTNYRPKYFKALKGLAWLIIVFAALCVLAPLVP